jgi:hypothetical protein
MHTLERTFDSFTSVQQNMEPISYLHSLWRPISGSTSIFSGTISADKKHSRVISQLEGKSVCRSFREQINRTLRSEIH